MTIATPVLSLFLEEDMPQPVSVSMPGAEVVVCSQSKPFSDRPNQDSSLVLALDSGCSLLAVADGMGGAAEGGKASSIAIHALAYSVQLSNGERDDLRDLILDAIEHSHAEIAALGVGAGTTLAAVELHERRMRPYHIGDSAILVVGQRGKIKLQSISHSPTGYAVEAGFLDEDEALLHGDRHFVSNVIGVESMSIEVGVISELAPRDTLLIASDGLTDNLTVAEIVELIRKGPLKRAAQGLLEACHKRMHTPEGDLPSKPDDVTVVLYRPRKERSTSPAESPAVS